MDGQIVEVRWGMLVRQFKTQLRRFVRDAPPEAQAKLFQAGARGPWLARLGYCTPLESLVVEPVLSEKEWGDIDVALLAARLGSVKRGEEAMS
eukprot:13482405-Alexandrium_andersonii.AAC.1